MKQIALISSLLLALLCSCSQPEQPMPAPETPLHDSLVAFDTLMQTCPDSALFALLDFNETHNDLTPFDRHYADLLISEALFKSDYEQTTRPALRQSLSYFDSLAKAYPKNDDCCLLSARSHYMNGVGLMEADSTVEACAEYLKALETVENHFDEKEIVGYKAKFMALTYNRLGQMFSDQLMTEQALNCLKKSLSFSKICPASKYSLSNAMVLIGTHFNMLNQPDSALLYFDMAEKSLPDTFNIVYRDILTSRSILLYDQKENAKDALNVLLRVKFFAKNDIERVSRELVISEILYREGMIDSAQACLEKVFNSDTDILSKIQAAKYLQEIHTEKREVEKSNEYANFLAPLAVESYEQKHNVSQMIEMFEDYQKHAFQKQHRQDSVSIIRKFLVIIGGLILIVIPIIIFTQRKIHLRKTSETEKKLELERMQHHTLVKRMKNNNARLKEENRNLSCTKTLSPVLQETKLCINDYKALMSEPICIGIINRLSKTDIVTTNPSTAYRSISLSSKEERLLDEAVEKHCPNFTNRIASLYPSLKNSELKICPLFLIGLTDTQIAVLIQNQFSSLWKKGREIRRKLNCEDIGQHLKNALFSNENA